MKKVFLIYHTDILQTWASHRVIGIASNLEKAIEMVKKDEDAITDVKNNDGQIVVYEHTIDEIDSEIQVFYTGLDSDREKILN